jgi:purine-binding chemotaxis protein CheW
MTGGPVVLLPVGGDVYAVPVTWIKEVVVAPTPTPLVTADPVVLGLFNLRGQIVPLLDTAALVGVGPAGPATHALVLSSPHGLVGLTATGFPQRAALGEPSGPSELPGTAGTYRLDRQVVVLIDPAALLATRGLGVAPVGAGTGSGRVA